MPTHVPVICRKAEPGGNKVVDGKDQCDCAQDLAGGRPHGTRGGGLVVFLLNRGQLFSRQFMCVFI